MALHKGTTRGCGGAAGAGGASQRSAIQTQLIRRKAAAGKKAAARDGHVGSAVAASAGAGIYKRAASNLRAVAAAVVEAEAVTIAVEALGPGRERR